MVTKHFINLFLRGYNIFGDSFSQRFNNNGNFLPSRKFSALYKRKIKNRHKKILVYISYGFHFVPFLLVIMYYVSV